MNLPHADVAELADAQVSEACDGDIVEVQVLSSAPFLAQEASPQPQISYLGFAGSLSFPIFGTHLLRRRISRVAVLFV